MLKPCDLALFKSVRVEPRDSAVSRDGVPIAISELPMEMGISWAGLVGGEPYWLDWAFSISWIDYSATEIRINLYPR